MNLLEARNLNKEFGRIKALDNISLGLRRHEILAIVGESGSGKSTLLNTLAGRVTPDSGGVFYDRGEGLAPISDLGELGLRRLQRAQWGFIQQDPRTALRLNITAGGNIGERLMAAGNRQLRRHPPHRRTLAGSGGNRPRADRRPAENLLRRHAATPADRGDPGDRA